MTAPANNAMQLQGSTEDLPSRRALLANGLAVSAGLAAVLTQPVRAEDKPADHEHMNHAEMDHSKMDHGSAPAPRQALIDAALHCVNKGEVCINHCIGLLSTGDTSLKDCIRSVSVMLPMCVALTRLAALDAKRLKDFAKVCLDVCADCEAECKKHAEHHAACKACGESCAACIKECKAVIES